MTVPSEHTQHLTPPCRPRSYHWYEPSSLLPSWNVLLMGPPTCIPDPLSTLITAANATLLQLESQHGFLPSEPCDGCPFHAET